MCHLVLMNDFFVKPKSLVLHDLVVSREVQNLMEAIAIVGSHTYPKFFMCMASNLERFKTTILQFFFFEGNHFANFESNFYFRANTTTAQSLE
jgi:hypothetical protein